MRSIPLSLLVTVMLTCASVQAEEQPAQPSAPAAAVDSQVLEQRLAQSEQLRNELEASSAVQLQRLRQENQRLRLQLKESQAQSVHGLVDPLATGLARATQQGAE